MEQRQVRPYSKEKVMEFARAVLQKEMNCSVKSISYVGGGSFGYVYKADISVAPHRVIVKSCRVGGVHLSEANALRLLGSASLIHIPQVYFTVDATDDIPMDFIVEEFVVGTDCFTDFSKLFLSKGKKKKFAHEIVDCLAHWHSITNDKYGDIDNPEYDNWLEYYKPLAEDILITAKRMNKDGLLNNKTLKTMQTAWAHFDFIFSEPVEKPSLIHGDLNVMNVMSDKNLNITAIIDPLDCKWADKEFELFQLNNLTGRFFNLYETYKSKYPVSQKCDLKCAFYAVYHEVYCYIASGTQIKFIMNTVVNRLNKELKKSGLVN